MSAGVGGVQRGRWWSCGALDRGIERETERGWLSAAVGGPVRPPGDADRGSPRRLSVLRGGVWRVPGSPVWSWWQRAGAAAAPGEVRGRIAGPGRFERLDDVQTDPDRPGSAGRRRPCRLVSPYGPQNDTDPRFGPESPPRPTTGNHTGDPGTCGPTPALPCSSRTPRPAPPGANDRPERQRSANTATRLLRCPKPTPRSTRANALGATDARRPYFGSRGAMMRYAFSPSPRRSRSSESIGSRPVSSFTRSSR